MLQHDACQAEVGDLHPLDTVFQHDVRRFDVAMDDSLLVGRRQAAGDLHADPQNIHGLERAIQADALHQGAAGDKLHDKEWNAGVLRDRVNRDDVRMIDARRRPRLAKEPFAGWRVQHELRRHQFDRDGPAELGVESAQHHTHGAMADDVEDLVVADAADRARPLGGVESNMAKRRLDRRAALYAGLGGFERRFAVAVGITDRGPLRFLDRCVARAGRKRQSRFVGARTFQPPFSNLYSSRPTWGIQLWILTQAFRYDS